MLDNEVCIVTAFKDLGRENWTGVKNGQVIPGYIKRTREQYFERFKRLTKLNNTIVCYIEDELYDELSTYVGDRPNVRYISMNKMDYCIDGYYASLVKQIDKVQKSPALVDFVDNKSAPEYWNAEYVAINFLKSFFVDYTIIHQKDLEHNEFAWIDFGYCREDRDVQEGKTFCFKSDGKLNFFTNGQFPLEYIQNVPILNLIKTGKVIIQGCHFIGDRYAFTALKQMMKHHLYKLLSIGLVDDDQTLLFMFYRESPTLCRLIYNDPMDWFSVIRNNLV